MNLLKSILFTLFVPGTITVVVPYLLLSSETGGVGRGSQMTTIVGWAAIGVGASIYLRAVSAFVLQGRGTPAPIAPPQLLVVSGMYRYVRNPMYLGVICVLFGEAVAFSSPTLVVYTAAVALLFHLFVVLYEEPRLRKQFGESYDLYRTDVPRWVLKAPGRGGEKHIGGGPSGADQESS